MNTWTPRWTAHGAAVVLACGTALMGCRNDKPDKIATTAPAMHDDTSNAAHVSPGAGQAAQPADPAAFATQTAPGLDRTPEWIEQKIARKQAKLSDARMASSHREAENRDLGDKPEDPEGLAQWRQTMRGGAKAIPPNALLNARDQAKRMPAIEVSEAQRDAGIWNWEWLGPGNIGGRSRSLLIHPTQTNTMWLGAVGGGIWKTVNGGGSWQPINDFLPALSVSCMALNPANPNVLYAGTGEPFTSLGLPGAGVFKSTDGGTTWNQLPDTVPATVPVTADDWAWVTRIAVAPLNSQIVLVANGSAIWRSTNGGADFNLVLREQVDDLRFRGSSNTVIAGTRDGVILKSNDAGVTWTVAPVSGNLFSTLFRLGFAPDPGSGNDLIPVNSTDGFAVNDRIRLGIVGDGEYVTVRGITDGQWLEVTDVQNSYTAGTQIAMEADGQVSALSVSTIPDGDTLPDTIDVGSTTGFYPGDRIVIYDASTREMATVQSIVDSNTLGVGDLSQTHGVNSRVRSMRNGRVEVAWGGSSTCYASVNRGGGAILRSDNSGDSWFSLDTTDDIPNYLESQGDYDNTIWVSPVNSNFIVVGGIDLWRDDNTATGLNLTRISDWLRYHLGGSAHADQHGLLAHPGFNGTSNKTVFVVNDGGVQRTPDITAIPLLDSINWVNLAGTLGITQFYAGDAAPDGSVILGGAQDNGRLRYKEGDGTSGWYHCENCTGDGGPCAVDPVNPSNLFTTTQNLSVWKSTDGGQFYFPATNGIDPEEPTAFIAPFMMDPTTPSTLFAAGQSIYRSTNRADSWSVIRTAASGGNSNCTALDVWRLNGSLVWLGYQSGRVSRVTSPWSWVNLDDNGPAPLPDRAVTDIALHPNLPAWAMVTIGGYNTDTIWLTIDNGSTWTLRHNNLPEVQINTVTFHPTEQNWVYVGTDIGVFASENLGMTWSALPRYPDVGSEGPVNTEVQHLFWQGSYLIAATHGRGMYRVLPLSTVYVDGLHLGCEDGTLACPYNSVAEALANQNPRTDIVIRGGITYLENGELVFQQSGEITSANGVAEIR